MFAFYPLKNGNAIDANNDVMPLANLVQHPLSSSSEHFPLSNTKKEVLASAHMHKNTGTPILRKIENKAFLLLSWKISTYLTWHERQEWGGSVSKQSPSHFSFVFFSFFTRKNALSLFSFSLLFGYTLFLFILFSYFKYY